MKIFKATFAVLMLALGFTLGYLYPKGVEKRKKPMNDVEMAVYAASLPNSDLLVINDGFFYSQPELVELHKVRPDIMCKDLAHKFGLLLDENEIEMRIDFFSPVDSIPVWQKDLYIASARYLKNNCGKYAAKWKVGNPNWDYYKKAVKFASIVN